MDLLGLVGSLLISHPWLALVPAMGFAALFRWCGRKVVGVAAAAWLMYACWEYALYRRWLCSGECNIRVDLLLIYPALLIVSLSALVVAMRAAARRKVGQGGVAEHATE